MNIEQLKAARDDLNRVLHSKSSEITWEDVVDILAPHWRTFGVLLDQAIKHSESATAINAPEEK
jgi:hypothetical protein